MSRLSLSRVQPAIMQWRKALKHVYPGFCVNYLVKNANDLSTSMTRLFGCFRFAAIMLLYRLQVNPSRKCNERLAMVFPLPHTPQTMFQY